MSNFCFRAGVLVLALAFAMAPLVECYEIPLTAHSVREAYFLGQRHDEKMTTLLAAYRQHLPLPKNGPHVAEIEVLTPYAQAVNESRQRLSYSAQQADQDYHARGDTIRVEVLIWLTPSYSLQQPSQSAQKAARGKNAGFRPEDFWQDFQFQLIQGDSALKWQEAYGQPEFSDSLIGARVWMTYDAAAIKSDDATVEVRTPDGQIVTAKFDLQKLR